MSNETGSFSDQILDWAKYGMYSHLSPVTSHLENYEEAQEKADAFNEMAQNPLRNYSASYEVASGDLYPDWHVRQTTYFPSRGGDPEEVPVFMNGDQSAIDALMSQQEVEVRYRRVTIAQLTEEFGLTSLVAENDAPMLVLDVRIPDDGNR
jgi:hypothetical protein